jgi:TonB-linked SusC/RagA family outer membrane protein
LSKFLTKNFTKHKNTTEKVKMTESAGNTFGLKKLSHQGMSTIIYESGKLVRELIVFKKLKTSKFMKKHRLQKIIGKIMRLSTIGIFIIRFSCLISFAENKAQDLLNSPVSLQIQNQSLRETLNQISTKCECKFVYSENSLPLDKKITFSVTNQRLRDVLDMLLRPYPVVYQPDGKFILIKRKETSSLDSETTFGLVSGIVTDKQTGQAMIGVNIAIKGTSQGTTTNNKGEYSLNVIDEDAILVFSFIGYITQEMIVGSHTQLNISMAPSLETLQDVVVIGYGQQKREKVTGAISKVKGEDLNQYAGSNFAQQLSGKAAGVLINDASAQPGTDPQVVIRGIGTLTAGRYPLIVVDGFPLSEGSSMNSINPGNITSVEILKDPSSAAIYGSRAANGVILITTKKGNNEKLTVTFDSYTGFQQRADKMKLTNAMETAQFFTEARDNAYVLKDPLNRSATDSDLLRITRGATLRQRRLYYLQPYLDKQQGLTDTDWLKEIFRNAPMSNHSLTFNGGNPKSSYFVGLNYFKQDGIVIGTGLTRYSANIKIESELNDRFTYGLSASPSYSIQNFFDNSNGNRSLDPISMALIMYPFFSPYKADGTLAISEQIVANTPQDGALEENPVAVMLKTKSQRTNFRTFGNTYLSAKIVKGLTYKISLGGDIANGFYDFYSPSDVGAYRTNASSKQASAIESNSNIVNYLIENTLSYLHTFGDHNIDILAGYTYQKESGKSSQVTGSTIADDKIPNIGGANAFTASANRYVWTQISYLGRIQYAFKEKYLLNLTARTDGSSRFGTNKKWGYFPSVNVGWILSKEDFLEDSQVLTFAKLRATWGKSGNNQIGNYTATSLTSSDNYVYGNTLAAGFAATSSANPNLTWETKQSFDWGIDIGFLHKLNLTADYYNTITTNLLLDVPVPQQSGYSSLTQNIGKVRNQGFEFELSGSDMALGKLKWNWNANIAFNKNEVMALGNGQSQIIALAGNNNAVFKTKIGGPVAEITGYNITGIYKNQDEINNTPHINGTLTGDYIIEDVDKDGKITENDKIGFGTYMPRFNYGFGSSLMFNRFEVNFAFAGIAGRKIYDIALVNSENGEGFSVPSKYYFENRYDPVSNPNGSFALPNMGSFSAGRLATNASSKTVYNADYFRLRSLQIAYTLPAIALKPLAGVKVKIYASANNVFTLTSFRGFNPEATSDKALTSGNSYSNYPLARTILCGLNLTF